MAETSGSLRSPTAYNECYAIHYGNPDHVLQCVSDMYEMQRIQRESNFATWLMVICGAMVFFMQAGFAMLCAGCVRKKNVQNTMLKNLLDACGSALSFAFVGYAFAYGGQNRKSGKTFIGTENFFLMGEDVDLAFFFFQFAFSAASVTIVAGTLAERCQMTAYLLYSVFLGGFVYPVIAHLIWSNNGFLSAFAENPYNDMGALDFAGSGVVHMTGGVTALIATLILGPRRGRFHDNLGNLLDEPRTIKGHSLALQVLGTLVLWFGWFGFNSGSALLHTNASDTSTVASRAAANTALSGASGAVAALILNAIWTRRIEGEVAFDLTVLINGALSGMVSITASSGFVETYASCLIGMVAGIIYLCTSHLLVRVRIDDAVDAIPVHLFNGIWGMLATGLFSSRGLVEDSLGHAEHAGLFNELGSDGSFDLTLLGNQVVAVLAILAWCITTMTPFFLILNQLDLFRAAAIDELVGLDNHIGGAERPELEDVTRDELKAVLTKAHQDLSSKCSSQNDATNDEMASSATGGNATKTKEERLGLPVVEENADEKTEI